MALRTGTCVATYPNASYFASCTQEAYAAGNFTAFIIDLTTGKYSYSTTTFNGWTNYVYNYSDCHTGSCKSSVSGSTGVFSHSGIFSWVIPLSTAMVSTDKYVLELEASTIVNSICDATLGTSVATSLSGCSAVTSEHLAFDLSSIVYT